MQQPDKSRLEVLKSQHLLTLKLLLAVQLAVLGSLYITAVYDGRYFVAHEDEVINFCSARLFSETGSVRAEGCIAEDVSRIGMMNWYGPGYHIIYGAFQSLFGNSPTLFIHLHFLFALLAAFGIFLLPLPIGPKLLAANIVVFSQQFAAYIFTYFPETLHILFAVILINILLRIFQNRDAKRRAKLVFAFAALVLVMSVVRVTTIFWLAALIGLSKDRKQAVQMSLLFVAGLALTMVYMKVLTAPPYAGEMQKLDKLYEFSLLDFVWKTAKAILRNTWTLVISGSAAVYFLLTLLVTASVVWWKTRSSLVLGGLIVSAMLIAALMAYYSPNPWYFLKQSAVLVPLLVIAILSTSNYSRPGFIMLAVALIVFSISISSIRTIIDERKNAFERIQATEPFRSNLLQISQHMNETEPVTVLWCYNEFDFGSATEALLPFSTPSHQPILYTTNIVLPGDPPEVRFKLHHKIKVDYILSRQALVWPNLKLVHSTEHYSFYRVIE
jgi:hypothetical protein